jgi:glycosyltransferase involved in cell wall biosynthesis
MKPGESAYRAFAPSPRETSPESAPDSSRAKLTRGISDERFRIAMVAACPMPARRGTPLRIERLAEALTARGHHVELITYHVAEAPQALGFPVHRIFRREAYWRMPVGPSLRKLALYDPVLALKVASVVAVHRFDVLHAHHVEGLLVSQPARMRSHLPLVYDAHTLLSAELPSYGPGPARHVLRKVGGWLDGVLPKRADQVVAVTSDLRDRLIGAHGLAPGRVSVVSNGVETERFPPQAAPPADGIIRVIYTGTLAPYQDVDLLLRAFAQAIRTRADLRLCFSVSSPFTAHEGLAKSLGVWDAIEVLPDGFSELPQRLAAASIAVLPRTSCPGIPQKLLNYMAAGKAIVASAGAAKLLEHERTGLVVANGDVAAFARALLRLAADPGLGAALGRCARELVEREYSWASAAERLEGIYSRLTVTARRAPA